MDRLKRRFEDLKSYATISVRTDLAHSWVIEANLRLLLAESFDFDVTP